MENEFINNIEMSGYIDFIPRNFTTTNGKVYFATILRSQRILGKGEKIFTTYFDIVCFNEVVSEQLMRLDGQTHIHFRGHITKDVYTNRQGNRVGSMRVLIDEIIKITPLNIPFKPTKDNWTRKDKPETAQEKVDIDKMLEEFEKNKKGKELAEDDLPF